MTKDRAQYLLQTRDSFSGFRWQFTNTLCLFGALYEDGITPEEDKYIRMIWTLMGDSSSYYDAVVKIAEGI